VQKWLFIEKTLIFKTATLILDMDFFSSSLSYKQKSLLAEISYLVFVSVISPLAVGIQLWGNASFTLSLVLLNILGLPVIVLFYRLYLPCTIGQKRYSMFLLLFPVYLVVYELWNRLTSLALIAMPFIPKGYRENLQYAHPEDFSHGYFNQTIGYTSLVLLAATSIYVIRLLFKNQQNLSTVETEKLRLELDHLKSQVQPHFFFNTLNNMYSLSVQKSPKTSEMIADLSGIMRYVLYNSQQDKVLLEKEVNFIKSYIHLENVRHDNPDAIEFLVQGDISNMDIEPLLFLPLIENAFKHSLQKNLTDKWVKLVLAVDEEELIFQTTNPVAEGENTSEQEGGIGLKNVRKRLELLYPNRHQLIVHQANNVFTVTLTLELNKR
jgi:two-component system LytT family sensor kinase